MNIRSLSINFVNLYTPSAPSATAARLPAAVSKEADNTKGYGDGHGAVRTNRLTQALTTALREIGIGGAGSPPSKATAPATTDTNDISDISDTSNINDISDTIDTAAASAATPSTSGEVNAAVEQFAHALMDALGAGRGARGHGGGQHQDGERSDHGHGSRNTRYGDFAQRLESLSHTIVQNLPAAQPPSASASTVVPVTEAPISLAPTVESELGVAAPGSAPGSAPTAPVPVPAPTRSATSTLLDAFSRLFDALKTPATADAPATDMATRLQQFLHTMAQTLSHSGMDGAAAHQTGAFVDVKA